MIVRLLAPAKLTLSLRITGVRPDGYHLIDAEMVTLDLCDELLVYPSETSSVEIVTLYNSSDSGRELPEIPADGDNLVIRALQLVGRTAHVEIRKRIPPGAGLGGGSSDAAAVLRWANRLAATERAMRSHRSNKRPSAHDSRHLGAVGVRQAASLDAVGVRQAASLGADVAFCLVGGRARVRGIGEIVEPLQHRNQGFTLLTPALHVDTATVYRRWDELGQPKSESSNDLEAAAIAAYPELSEWRDALAHTLARRPQLAGSGGTWFATAPWPMPPIPESTIPSHRAFQHAKAIGRL